MRRMLTNSSWRSKTLRAFMMEPLSLSMEEESLAKRKSFGLG